MRQDSKVVAIEKMKELVERQALSVVEENLTKPWGAYLRFDDGDGERFVGKYFASRSGEVLGSGEELSPKFLLIAPESRLSWQYHHRRSELWTLVDGPGGVVLSETDEQGDPVWFEEGKIYESKCGMRHRLVGGDSWSLMAEIWMHTDPNNPSEEEDNVRLEDDYDRQGTTDRGEATFFK